MNKYIKDILIISAEENILHISLSSYCANYFLYDKKGKYLISGTMESSKYKMDVKDISIEIIKLIDQYIPFTEPYLYLYDEQTKYLRDLIMNENNKKDIEKMIQEIERTGD